MIKKIINKLPARFQWTLHNVVGHPLSEVLFQVGAHKASDWIHDNTIPGQFEGHGQND